MVCATAAVSASIAQAGAGNGGSGIPTQPKPRVTDVRCKTNGSGPCVDVYRVERGGTVKVKGRHLAGATQVIFYGRSGPRDDVSSPVTLARPRSAKAQVPESAKSGPVGVTSPNGKRSGKWSGLMIDDRIEVLYPSQQLGPGAPVRTAISKPRKIFYGGLQKAVFTYQIESSRPLNVRVNLVRFTDGLIVRAWSAQQVQPGVPQKVVWDGTVMGRVVAEGRYSFQVTTAGAARTKKKGRRTAGPHDSVTLYNHMFPIRGRHTYGRGGARFGAGRGGRSHQGHDVFARCGTPLVAARAGKVLYSGYHQAAGYYVTISGKETGLDYMYAHLAARALVKTGQSVRTGQQLGRVGDSGNARGCHLHFELWSPPGWYRGGRPFNPLPSLKHWDRGS